MLKISSVPSSWRSRGGQKRTQASPLGPNSRRLQVPCLAQTVIRTARRAETDRDTGRGRPWQAGRQVAHEQKQSQKPATQGELHKLCFFQYNYMAYRKQLRDCPHRTHPHERRLVDLHCMEYCSGSATRLDLTGSSALKLSCDLAQTKSEHVNSLADLWLQASSEGRAEWGRAGA